MRVGSLVGFAKENLFLVGFIFIIITTLIISFSFAGQSTGTSQQLTNSTTNESFNFSAGAVVAGLSDGDGHFTWNGSGTLTGFPETLTTEQAIHTLNGWKVDGLGPNKVIGNICSVSFTPIKDSFPIYANGDGFVLYNPTTLEYAPNIESILALQKPVSFVQGMKNSSLNCSHNVPFAPASSQNATGGVEKSENVFVLFATQSVLFQVQSGAVGSELHTVEEFVSAHLIPDVVLKVALFEHVVPVEFSHPVILPQEFGLPPNM